MWELIASHCFWILYLQPKHSQLEECCGSVQVHPSASEDGVGICFERFVLQSTRQRLGLQSLFGYSLYSERDDKSSAANPLRKVPLATIFYGSKWLRI
jgi:hypothetical protein